MTYQHEVETHEQSLEVVIMWGDNEVLRVEHLRAFRSFAVGEGADFLIDPDLLGMSQLPIVRVSDNAALLVFPRDAEGYVDGDDLPTLIASGLARGSVVPDCYELPIDSSMRAAIRYRGFTFWVRSVNAGKAVGTHERAALDWREQVWTGVSCAVHGLFLAAMYFMPPGASALSLDMSNDDMRRMQYLLAPVVQPEVETPAWMKPTPSEGGTGKAHKDDAGKMGKSDAKPSKHRYAIQGPADNRDPHMARTQALAEAKQVGILGVLSASKGAWNSPTSPFGAESAIGYDPVSAMGALFGEQIGENSGFNGLALHGTSRGGGGDGEGTIGVGKLGTIGHGDGPQGDGRYGSSVGQFVGRKGNVPTLRSGTPEVLGSLSKEVIRRQIQRHLNEVRFCYEQQLSSRPDLSGRVEVKFLIAPTGVVQSAAVARSTLASGPAEECIAKAVRRWSFPAPDGGGMVVVTYPFVLETAH